MDQHETDEGDAALRRVALVTFTATEEYAVDRLFDKLAGAGWERLAPRLMDPGAEGFRTTVWRSTTSRN